MSPLMATFQQPNSQVTGRFGGNANLQPETGDVLTAGFVYQPSFLEGLFHDRRLVAVRAR